MLVYGDLVGLGSYWGTSARPSPSSRPRVNRKFPNWLGLFTPWSRHEVAQPRAAYLADWERVKATRRQRFRETSEDSPSVPQSDLWDRCGRDENMLGSESPIRHPSIVPKTHLAGVDSHRRQGARQWRLSTPATTASSLSAGMAGRDTAGANDEAPARIDCAFGGPRSGGRTSSVATAIIGFDRDWRRTTSRSG